VFSRGFSFSPSFADFYRLNENAPFPTLFCIKTVSNFSEVHTAEKFDRDANDGRKYAEQQPVGDDLVAFDGGSSVGS
jgi:hypothetical protein